MSGLAEAQAKLRDAGMPDAAVATFTVAYEALAGGDRGVLPTAEIEPVRDVPALEDLPAPEDTAALERAVVVKLNGGLGTSMGMSRAKALIEARDGLSFLDITARQVLALRRAHGVRLPLVLMDSFRTRDDTLAALERYEDLPVDDLPLDFLQHQEPKLRADDLAPVDWPADPALEWCPPGHGDVYPALQTSGMLDALRERGFRHAFRANADNLGAVLDPRILAWFAASGAPFAMEVVLGTEADRKGGHLARRRADGRLVLRETAQTPPEDAGSFRDFERWRFYNSNNLWVDLDALAALLDERGGALGLPLIVNRKTVDPRAPDSPEVVQLESAMGAAVSVFDGARAVCVPRSRFAPVKTTDDLLVLRSDVYELADDCRVLPRAEAPFVELDPAVYKRIDDFEARFDAGPPSLAGCTRFVVHGDVRFGRGVVARGEVELHGPAEVPDGARL